MVVIYHSLQIRMCSETSNVNAIEIPMYCVLYIFCIFLYYVCICNTLYAYCIYEEKSVFKGISMVLVFFFFINITLIIINSFLFTKNNVLNLMSKYDKDIPFDSFTCDL